MTRVNRASFTVAFAVCAGLLASSVGHAAQQSSGNQPAVASRTTPPAPERPTVPSATSSAPVPADYVIGADDVLGVLFWRDQEMSGDVTVRPDGMITLPLLRDIRAAGLTPDVLRSQIQQAASKYIADPNVTVVVRQINSRKVFITGQVARPGPYPMPTPMTVMQLIAVAGGLLEFADDKNVTVMRTEGGKAQSFKFSYRDVARGRNLDQNITLRPGDTVVVP